jgi:hypothetical protein
MDESGTIRAASPSEGDVAVADRAAACVGLFDIVKGLTDRSGR